MGSDGGKDPAQYQGGVACFDAPDVAEVKNAMMNSRTMPENQRRMQFWKVSNAQSRPFRCHEPRRLHRQLRWNSGLVKLRYRLHHHTIKNPQNEEI